MNETDAMVQTTLRIPGTWRHLRELTARMPAGFRLNSQAVILPDGTEIECTPLPPDDQFAKIFQSVCRHPASEDEMRRVNRYTVSIGLTGPGGSMAAALTMMRAGAAIVRAGGAGVFIDNSALAHGGGDWIKMTEDSSCDAVSFAFVNAVRGRREVRTMGMRVMGLPDIVMQLSDIGDDGEVIIEAIRCLCRGEKPLGPGHMLAGEAGPWLQVLATDRDQLDVASPMRNPFGRLKLVRFKGAAESN
ncbi:MAG: hypothetical protein ACYC0X_08395 [Pirellulaceae bacterium]